MEFRILGPLEVRDGDREVPVRGGKQRALLALLLVNANRTLAIARIVDELWGERVPESAHKMVQISVSKLRKLLPPGTLHTRPPGYALVLEREQLDLHRFEGLVAEARAALDAGRAEQASIGFRAALSLWRGPALAEFASEPFAQPEGARLEDLRVYALEGRIEADLLLGRHGDLVGELEALVARYPLREGLRRQHMLALYRSGRQPEALAVYHDARRVLADDLGLEPSPALRRLEQRILQHDPSLDLAPREPVFGAPVTQEPATATPVGRESDAGRLRDCLAAALGGQRQVVFVSGEAGIGKTTLVEAFLRGAGEGLLVGYGQCVEQHGAGEPYMPVLDALGRICDSPRGKQVAALLLERAPTWAIQMPAVARPHVLERLQRQVLHATRDRMLRELVETLDALADFQPLVLVLEDLQWSDYSTLDLLMAVARRREPARLLVIGTYRPADAHAIQMMARELRLRGFATEIAPARFGEREVDKYLQARLPGHDLSDDVPRVLVERTAGNPLFLEKVVDAWIEQGLVRRDDGGWRAAAERAELTRAVPETLRQLITQWLLELSGEDRQILETASVAGPEFAAALVAAASGLPEDEVESRCDALAADVVFLSSREHEDWPDGTISGRYAFTHDLYREVLYDGLSPARRARMHRAIGGRLERAFAERGREISAELATHFLRGGNPARAFLHLRVAAEQALDRRAPREALAHLKRALALLGSVSDPHERAESELKLQTMLGPALISVEGWSSEHAEAAILRARELAEELGRAEARAWSNYKLATLYEVGGRYEASQALLEETLAEGGARALAVDSYELLACSLFHQGAFARAFESAERGLALHDEALSTAWSAEFGENPGTACHSWAAISLWFLGYPDQARERVRRAIELSERPAGRHGRATAFAYAALVAQLRLDPDETLAAANAAVEAGTEMGFAYRVAMGTILRGWARAAKGDSDRGIDELKRGLMLARSTGVRMDDSYFLGILADAYARGGTFADGLEAVDTGLDHVPRAGQFFYGAELHRLRGELLLGEGERDEGEAALWRALEAAQAQGSPSLELRAALSLACVLREQGRVDEARSLVRSAHAPFAEGFATADLRAATAFLHELGEQAPAPARARRADRPATR